MPRGSNVLSKVAKVVASKVVAPKVPRVASIDKVPSPKIAKIPKVASLKAASSKELSPSLSSSVSSQKAKSKSQSDSKAPPRATSPEVKIFVTNTYSYLRTTRENVVESVYKELTLFYKNKFAWGTIPQRSPVPFMTKKGGRFGTGLLPLVTKYLDKSNEPYSIQDERQHLASLFSEDPLTTGSENIQINPDGDLFADRGVTLRDYQVKAVNAALQEHRGIIKCATGGGKSWILAAIIKVLGEGVPVVIMVRQRILIDQLYETLTRAGIKDVGRVSGTYKEPKTVTICTIQSLRVMDEFLKKARVLMVDEVHDFTSEKSQATMNGFPHAYMRLGFSATPFKNDIHKYTVMSCFGPAIVDISTTELIEKKVLAPSVVHVYPIKYPKVRAETWNAAETRGIVNNDYFHKAVVALINSIPSGRIMVLVKRIPHGDALHALMPGSFWISGKDDMESRGKVIQMLRTATQQKVVALMSSVGFVGLDVFVHHVVNAAGGREPYLTIQKIGRGLRISEDKTTLDYHDFHFSYGMNPVLAFHSKLRIKTLEEQGHKVVTEAELPVPRPSKGSDDDHKYTSNRPNEDSGVNNDYGNDYVGNDYVGNVDNYDMDNDDVGKDDVDDDDDTTSR